MQGYLSWFMRGSVARLLCAFASTMLSVNKDYHVWASMSGMTSPSTAWQSVSRQNYILRSRTVLLRDRSIFLDIAALHWPSPHQLSVSCCMPAYQYSIRTVLCSLSNFPDCRESYATIIAGTCSSYGHRDCFSLLMTSSSRAVMSAFPVRLAT